MKTKIHTLILLGILSFVAMTSCQEEDKRTVYPHSTPVIESTNIDVNIIYGDSINFSAKLSDPQTPLSTLEVTIVAADKVIGRETFITRGQNVEVSGKIATKFIAELPDNAAVEIILKLTNVEGDVTTETKSSVGKRAYFSKLYAVLEDGSVVTLTANAGNPDLYESANTLSLSNKVVSRIAEKLTPENEIDFTGRVWGILDDAIQLIDITGDYITTYNERTKITRQFVFDSYTFSTDILGDEWPVIDELKLSDFEATTINGEAFMTYTLYLEKNQDIVLANEFSDILFNLDYFERLEAGKVKYLAETGPIILHYSATRKFVIVEEPMQEFPTVLLVCGVGLGYPSKAVVEATSQWGFEHLLKYVIFRRIETDVYQGTVYFDAALANFKPFEDSNWGNEKASTDFTMPAGLLVENPKGDWDAAPSAVSGNYKITINLKTKVVIAESVELP